MSDIKYRGRNDYHDSTCDNPVFLGLRNRNVINVAVPTLYKNQKRYREC
ncbi:hypothetical protein M7I_6430 [Glarea lozoyensis 74030]|uniref:Uncharacterized protein n=1 Tax=Glarea lozoyensis (strain ATCC 74030 / MF5533) TaxID=1104152 RepID=H0EUJ5_GLAL7|nr:hypothetical protein M7I_6430 [Glarea lozoyensis 74030]